MIKKYTLTDDEFAEIIKINKEGGDPVMYISCGIPIGLSLQEKINNYWKKLGKQKGFDWRTIKPINRKNFYAETIES